MAIGCMEKRKDQIKALTRGDENMKDKPVVMRADFKAAGLQVRCRDLTIAAAPVTWGHDIDVPEIML